MPKFIQKSSITKEYTARIKEKSEKDWDFALNVFLLEFSEEISKQLERKNINKAQLSEILGTSRSYVTQLLNGKPNLRLETLFKVCFSVDLIPRIEFLSIQPTNFSSEGKSSSVSAIDLSNIRLKTDVIKEYEEIA